MANPTTNYGFVLPTPTDLVTDLPADFDVALQGVDTRLKALQPGTTAGDLAYSSATANTNVRLGIGSTNQVLAVVGGVPAWTTTADVTPLTTKGDLFTFSTVDARLAVGTNGQVLTADSSEATGLKYATPASGSMTKITSATFTAVSDTSTTFDGVFTSTYRNYFIEMSPIRGSVSSAAFNFQLREAGPTTQAASYYGNRLANATVTNTSNGTSFTLLLLETEDAGVTMNFFRAGTPTSWSYSGFQRQSTISMTGACMNDSVGANLATGFILSAGSGTITGTVAVYGLEN